MSPYMEVLRAPVDRVILYGRSVGTGPAAAAAARLSSAGGDGGGGGGGGGGPPAALVLQSPYTSILDFAKDKAVGTGG